MIRTLSLLDLPTLHRYRARGVFLDSTMAFTWGGTLIPAGALLSYLAPATGVYTFLSKTDGHTDPPVIAQVIHNAHSPSARFSFLAPDSALDSPALPNLLDHVAAQVGERGAHNLLAEVEESTLTYEAMRKAGFAVYARQQIYMMTGAPALDPPETNWRLAAELDEFAVHTLYSGLVPAMVQQVEPQPWSRLNGLILREEGDVQAFVDLNYGPKGILAQPFIHPDTENVVERLADLWNKIPKRRSRPIYFCVRSYQAWLGSALEELGAQPGPRHAVMVKRLAIPQKETRPITLPSLEGSRPGISTPIVRAECEPVQYYYEKTTNYG